MGVKELTPALFQEMQSALLAAFPTRFEIEQFVLFQLGERLDHQIGGAHLTELTFNLIKWVEARGRVDEVVDKACAERPGNERLSRFKARWEAGSNSLVLSHLADAGYDKTWHVARSAVEQVALAHLCNDGEPAVLCGPRKCGRTWLMDHLIDRWKALTPHGLVVRVSLLGFLPAIGDINRLVDEMGDAFVGAAKGPDEWKTVMGNRAIAPMSRLSRLLTRHVLPSLKGPMLLAVDEADALLQGNAEVSDSFFGGLRSWMDDRGKPLSTEVRLILAISTTPAQLIRGQRLSPFNIVRPVEVTPFTAEDAKSLARRSELALSETDVVDLMRFTGGHPYLMREVLRRVPPGGGPLPLDPRLECFREHLQLLRSYLREADLERHLRAVLAKPDTELEADVESRLMRSGIVKRDPLKPGRLLPSCGLYDSYFRPAS